MDNEENKTKTELYWEKRTLCSDPACIGVIGPDGKCKECGKPYEGEALEDSPFEAPEPETDDIAETPEDDQEERETSESDEADETETDDEWENRTLCSDPACIGVIGPGGKCKECGKPRNGE